MSRSLKKGPYIDERLMAKVKKADRDNRAVINTWSRNCSIVPEMVGFKFGVHNGKIHVPVLVTEHMIGHRLGEFAPTVKFLGHGGKLAKDQATGTPAPAAPAAAKK